jgi:small GTP-binding protein
MECASFTFKLIAAGDGGVGKTTMFYKYIDGIFKVDTQFTIGVQIFNKNHVVENGRIAALQLWDFGGQERFRFFLDNFVMGANGVLLLFDLTCQESFEHLINWLPIVRKYDTTVPMVLIGAKNDLKEDIVVSDEEAFDFIEKHGIKHYLKASSKTGYNIEEVFDVLLQDILEYKSLAASSIHANHLTPSEL